MAEELDENKRLMALQSFVQVKNEMQKNIWPTISRSLLFTILDAYQDVRLNLNRVKVG